MLRNKSKPNNYFFNTKHTNYSEKVKKLLNRKLNGLISFFYSLFSTAYWHIFRKQLVLYL